MQGLNGILRGSSALGQPKERGPVVAEPAAGGVCPQCGGRGWVVQRDRGAGSARPCDCRKQQLALQRLEYAGIPDRYQRCRLANFHATHHQPGVRAQLQRALAQSRQYVDAFLRTDGRYCETGLLYVGPPGVGKTHLASAVLAELVTSYPIHGRFVDFTSLLHRLQASFETGAIETKSDILDPIVGAELLVVDELGAQKPTPWVQDILYLLINTRYSRRLPTIFTSNYGLDPVSAPARSLDRGADPEVGGVPLSRRIPASLVSRLCEMARPVLLDGVDDHRREVDSQSLRA